VRLTPPGERFPHWVRIARRSDFQRVYEGGRKCVRRFLVVYALERAGDGPLPTRIGLTVSRKVGKANVRNRVRRRLRDRFRRIHGRLHPGWDIVINGRVAARDATFDQLAKDLERCLEELGLVAAQGGEAECDPSGRPTPPSSPDRGSCGDS